jgi:RNA polymerase sigma factor for flagellar operon FliA
MAHLDASDLAETWQEFKASSDLSYRNQLILHYTSLVRYVAAKVGGTLPSTVDREDLVSYGMFGLIDAIDKFDITKGVKFETYGVSRIRGAIYDEIRAMDWVPRSIRSKARDIEKARAEIEMTLGRPAEHGEVAQNLGLSMEEYWQLVSQANAPSSSVDSLDGGWAHQEDSDKATTSDVTDFYRAQFDPAGNPEDLAQTSEVIDLVGEAINKMDERSKTILVLYYLQEMTLAEIGQILGVTESRVCQLQSKVLLALRDSLGQGGLSAA